MISKRLTNTCPSPHPLTPNIHRTKHTFIPLLVRKPCHTPPHRLLLLRIQLLLDLPCQVVVEEMHRFAPHVELLGAVEGQAGGGVGEGGEVPLAEEAVGFFVGAVEADWGLRLRFSEIGCESVENGGDVVGVFTMFGAVVVVIVPVCCKLVFGEGE